MKRTLISCLLSAFIAVPFYGGCDKDKDKTTKAEEKKTEEKADEEERTETEKVEKDEPAPLPKVELHKEISDAIHKAASDCDLTQSTFTFKCEEYKNAGKVYQKTGQSEPAKAIETISVMFTDEDPNISNIASRFLSSYTSSFMASQASKQPDFIDKATGERLLAGMKKLAESEKEEDKIRARQIVEQVTHAATLAGLMDEVVEIYKEVKDVHVKRRILENIMRYGRMAGFPVVKQAVEGDDANMKAAGLRATLNMPRWTDEEREVLCPFGAEYLSDENIQAATHAAGIVVRCKHEEGYVDKLLEEGRRRVKEGQWEGDYVFPYRDVCFRGFFGKDKIPPEETCEKVYNFLEWVANQNNVDPTMRGRALGMIYYQRRDAKTHKLLRKYRRHKVKEVQQAALEAMKSLEETYLKK